MPQAPTLPIEERTRVAQARVARLATSRPDGGPHVVPITFALVGDSVVTVVDQKPKRTLRLQRLLNVATNPRASMLVDHYEDDWTALWWVRIDGRADVLEEGRLRATLLAPLVAKYPAYRRTEPTGPLLRIGVEAWSSWSAAGDLPSHRRHD
jgi:PPOX class probable F420-dependent enzyme